MNSDEGDLAGWGQWFRGLTVHFCLSQYFEYSSHKELRHNIGKELCLRATPHPEAVKIEACQRRGMDTGLAPQEEWIFTEVIAPKKTFGL